MLTRVYTLKNLNNINTSVYPSRISCFFLDQLELLSQFIHQKPCLNYLLKLVLPCPF